MSRGGSLAAHSLQLTVQVANAEIETDAAENREKQGRKNNQPQDAEKSKGTKEGQRLQGTPKNERASERERDRESHKLLELRPIQRRPRHVQHGFKTCPVGRTFGAAIQPL